MPRAISIRSVKGPDDRDTRASRPVRALREEQGDWAIPAALTLALGMLGALAFGLDAVSVGYGRLRLWSAVAATARASARCLKTSISPSSSSSILDSEATSACVSQTAQTVFSQDLRTGSVLSGSVEATPTLYAVSSGNGSAEGTVPSVQVDSQATLRLAFPLPGLDSVTLEDAATASLVPVPASTTQP